VSVLIIGTGDRARELSEKLRAQSEWGIDIIGHLDPDPARVGSRILDSPVLGTVADIGRVLKDNVVDEVIVAIPRSMLSDAEIIASACEEEGIQLRFMADVFNLEAARVRLIKLGKIPLLTMEPVFQDELKLLVKRCLDFVITVAAMPVVLPIIGVIAAAIKLDSPGTAFFVQKRVGFKKRIFPMFKFRSMYMGAEVRMSEFEHLNEAQDPIFKIADDPRVTRVGRFLRRTSLDELPQLFNVLRGEMSLVGPRPMSTRDVKLFDRGIQRKRFSVKPGITCLWQISGRSNLPFEKWLEMDIQYIENWSLFLDFKILLKTIPAVLFARGAV
jgi:exopolysaccharide biosynthesis polyprenyl glycosylphosphotransferase